MKILIITASNPYRTAGVVALDLYNGLKRIDDNEVKILTRDWGDFSDENILSLEDNLTFWKNRIIRKCRKIASKLGLKKKINQKIDKNYSVQDYDQTITLFKTKDLLNKINFIPDKIIVLFMQNFISFKNLFELNEITKAPIFLYMMDMAPLTGGCHYAWHCTGYMNTCGKCSAIYSSITNDQSRKNWTYKKHYLDNTNLKAIAATEQQYQQLLLSGLYKNKQKEKLLISVEESIYKPGDKELAKQYFDLPKNKKIIFFGAVNIKSKRKGFKELKAALSILKGKYQYSDIHLAIAGNLTQDLIRNLPFDYTALGYLNQSQLATAYRAVDVFVSPSIEDSGPMMINQSIMSGTPVVAFEIGVAFDLVITGQTGYLAKLKDSTDFAQGIMKILELTVDDYNQYSVSCRQKAINNFTPIIQAKNIMQILKQ